MVERHHDATVGFANGEMSTDSHYLGSPGGLQAKVLLYHSTIALWDCTKTSVSRVHTAHPSRCRVPSMIIHHLTIASTCSDESSHPTPQFPPSTVLAPAYGCISSSLSLLLALAIEYPSSCSVAQGGARGEYMSDKNLPMVLFSVTGVPRETTLTID